MSPWSHLRPTVLQFSQNHSPLENVPPVSFSHTFVTQESKGKVVVVEGSVIERKVVVKKVVSEVKRKMVLWSGKVMVMEGSVGGKISVMMMVETELDGALGEGS